MIESIWIENSLAVTFKKLIEFNIRLIIDELLGFRNCDKNCELLTNEES